MSAERSITCANDETLRLLIRKAQRRVVAVAPAFTRPVADALCERWNALGADGVHVIVDLHPEVFRLGYGEFEAVKSLEQTASKLGVMLQRQPGIRIGLIISDDTTLIYAPIPQLIEAGPSSPDSPNAILLNTTPPAVEKELGQGANGVLDQVIGEDKAERANMAEVEEKLKQNPPQKFNVARTVRVFNAFFEFVEFELSGTSIDRKTVSIPSELIGVGDEATQRQLRASFRLIPEDHDLSGEHLVKDKNLIAKKFLKVLPTYGTVVQRSRKAEFEKAVAELRTSVEAFQTKVKEELQATMDKTQKSLCEALLPSLRQTPPKAWIPSNSAKPDDATLRQFLQDTLRKAFGSADQLIKHMSVNTLFKGVTYEMLTEDKFIATAKKVIPELDQLHSEFDAAEGEPPTGDAL